MLTAVYGQKSSVPVVAGTEGSQATGHLRKRNFVSREVDLCIAQTNPKAGMMHSWLGDPKRALLLTSVDPAAVSLAERWQEKAGFACLAVSKAVWI